MQSKNPSQLFERINQIYKKFDEIVQEFKLFKVEHIERDYVVASQIVETGELDISVDTEQYRKDTAEKMIYLGLALMNEGSKYPEIKFKVGIASGPIVAGIIGSSRKFYRLFGDTINTASRMKHHGKHKHVHMSESTVSHL